MLFDGELAVSSRMQYAQVFSVGMHFNGKLAVSNRMQYALVCRVGMQLCNGEYAVRFGKESASLDWKREDGDRQTRS